MRFRRLDRGGGDRTGGEGTSRRRAREGAETQSQPSESGFGTDSHQTTERSCGADWRHSCDEQGRGDRQRWVEGDPRNRFWIKVSVVGDCWWWAPNGVESTRGLDIDGYGRFYQRVDGKPTNRKAHVVAWEFTHGPVTDGHRLDHLCHSYDDGPCPGGRGCWHRRCVRPAHLEEVTVAENNQRRVARQKRRAS